MPEYLAAFRRFVHSDVVYFRDRGYSGDVLSELIGSKYGFFRLYSETNYSRRPVILILPRTLRRGYTEIDLFVYFRRQSYGGRLELSLPYVRRVCLLARGYSAA